MSSLSGVLVLILYLGLGIVSSSLYPSPFGSGTNWLSDLDCQQLVPPVHGASLQGGFFISGKALAICPSSDKLCTKREEMCYTRPHQKAERGCEVRAAVLRGQEGALRGWITGGRDVGRSS